MSLFLLRARNKTKLFEKARQEAWNETEKDKVSQGKNCQIF